MQVELPIQLRSGAVSSIDAKTRTFELTWTTGASVRRGGFWSDPYNEELSLAPEAVRMGRLNGGAPLLNSHEQWDLRGVIGVVEKAWLTPTDGRASVRMSQRADVEPLWSDVRDKIIRNVSVGYLVHQYEDVTERGAKLKTFRAVDWEPTELSLVPVGADAGAGVRSDSAMKSTCLIDIRSHAEILSERPAPAELVGTGVDILRRRFALLID